MLDRWIIRLLLVYLGIPCACFAAPPQVTHFLPAGVQRGQTVKLSAHGRFEAWPVQVSVEPPGLRFKPLAAKGQLEVSASADVEPGVYWVRLFNLEGAAAPQPLLVGSIPELLEQEPNDHPRQPQQVELSTVTINGVLQRAGDVDGFSIRLQRGQTVVASVDAHRRLGSPMDGVLQMVSADGFVLAQNDDAPQLDPRLVFKAPVEGSYTVRLFAFPAKPDSSIRFAGGDRFVYRLTLATDAFVDHTLPLAVSGGESTQLQLVGWNIPAAARLLNVQSSNPIDDGSGGPSLIAVHRADLANTFQVRVEPHPTLIEEEPNEHATAQQVSLPITITGRINAAGDADVYEFAAQKDQRVVFTAAARRLGFLLDPVLRLLDQDGKQLAAIDDIDRNNRDAELIYTFPQAGRYRLEIRDANQFGGLRYVYQLRMVEAQADVRVKLSSERLTATVGTPLEIPVTVEPHHGFGGQVEIEACDLPQGVQADSVTVTIKSKPSKGKVGSAVKATLKLVAAARVSPGPIRIEASSVDGPPVSRTATATIPGFPATTTKIWLTVKPK